MQKTRRNLGWLGLCLLAGALTGCQSGTNYSSPRVTGRVLAADTRQPLPEATVRRVVPYPTDGEDTAPKGGMLQMRPAGLRVDADGRFVLDATRVLTLFRRSNWHSVTVAVECPGYEGFQTNYSVAQFGERSPEGVPLVNASDILLAPAPGESTP